MWAASPPAGDPRPSPPPDPPSQPGAPPPSAPDTTSSSDGGREAGGRWAAAVLLLTHVVEIAAMVASTLASGLAAHRPPPPPPPPGEPPAPTHAWGGGSSALPLQVTMGGAPLVVVTAISLVWAVRAQDFSGRATARMLCWLLHLLQASVLWRFLKVHLAFDSGDVAELGTLRFVQVHVHTLPFLVVHVACMVGDGGRPGALQVLVAAVMVVSAVVTIVVSTTAARSARPSSLTPPTITQVAHAPLHGPSGRRSHDAAARAVVAVTSSCVVWSRALAVAALLRLLHLPWACALVFLHWLAALLWLGLQPELEPTALGPVRRALRRAFLAYLLLWDWHVFRDDATALTVCARPRLPAAYYTISAVQNVAVTATWYGTGRAVLPAVRTAALSSVLTAQTAALLLLALSYLYCSSLLPSWPRQKASGASLVIPGAPPDAASAAPPSAGTADADRRGRNNSYVDFKDAEEGELPGVVEGSIGRAATPPEAMPPAAHSTPRTPLPLAPRLMAAHLPPAMFSFSHDLLPLRLAKSERSSTDNGSFNSRNTNTLPTQLPPECDLLRRVHGSFSDSFSSLSCGTNHRASAPVGAPAPPQEQPRARKEERTPPAGVAFASHSSCRDGFCHCRLFDGIESHCGPPLQRDAEGREATEGSKVGVAGPFRSAGLRGVLRGSPPPPRAVPGPCGSAPKVAVVRGVQRFRVVCAACLYAHDPLLTRCRAHTPPPPPPPVAEALLARCHAHAPDARGGGGGGSSTDYPSDTEATAKSDTLSSSASADSHSTYSTWPVGRGPGMARLLQLHPGSHDYVTAWLRHQQARGPRLPQAAATTTLRRAGQEDPAGSPEPPARRKRRVRRLQRPHLLQDLETVV